MKNKIKIILFLFFLFASIFARFIPLKLPNIELFSSLIAISILLFDSKYLPFISLVAVLISDLLLFFVLHVPFSLKWELIVVISWSLVVLTQKLLKGFRFLNVLSMEIIGTLVFFFVSNSLVFFAFNFYPKNFYGYVSCLIAGLPFLRNQLLYNTLFSFVVYGSVFALRKEQDYLTIHENP